MEQIKNLISVIVSSIVDEEGSVEITEEKNEKGVLFEIRVSKNDAGKLIGKQGRIASALRTLVKAAGAKAGERIFVNVHKDPIEED